MVITVGVPGKTMAEPGQRRELARCRGKLSIRVKQDFVRGGRGREIHLTRVALQEMSVCCGR